MPRHASTAAGAALFRPRHWLTWFGIGLGWLLVKLPYRPQMAVGRALGRLAFHIVRSRRRVADINLQLAYPALSESARRRLLKRHFESVGMGVIETGLCWWGSQARVDRLTHIEGLENLKDAAAQGRGILLLSAHFTCLELGVRMVQGLLHDLGLEINAMYKPPHDPVIDHVMRRGRAAHMGGTGGIRHDDIKTLLKVLRRGDAVWYASDQKAHGPLSARVEFFGQPAQTHTAISRIARISKATIVPFFALRKADGSGYRAIILPMLDDLPGASEAEDAQRINNLIESMVDEDPAQYFWLHQRFKYEGHDPYGTAD